MGSGSNAPETFSVAEMGQVICTAYLGKFTFGASVPLVI